MKILSALLIFFYVCLCAGFCTTFFIMMGCTDPVASRRILEANGFTDIEITGYNLFSCSDEDTYHTGFKAKASNGTYVRGTVCSGLIFKNHTIRFE